MTYEGKGPHGSLIFVECATDNTTRSVANVRSYFNKCDGTLLTTGAIEFMFERKCIIEFPLAEGMDVEEMELELIDAGIEEIEENEGVVYVTGDFTNFGSLTAAFDEMKIELTKATLERIATTPLEFTEEQLADIEKLLEKLDEDDDVVAVYNNIA
jgi:transcriptional/translational regulatory protein YebC/TACO1